MSHDYNYRSDSVVLSTHADIVRLTEDIGGKRADLVEIAYKHGVYVAPRHWSAARLARLETRIRIGTAQENHQRKSALVKALTGGIKTFARNDPEFGEVEAEILVSDPTQQGDMNRGRFGLTWPVWFIRGYWEGATASHDVDDTTLGASADLTTINVGGDHPTEPVFTVTCQSDGANPAIEDPATGDKITLADSFVATDVIEVDVPNRVAKKNGTRVKNLVSINRGHWMEFEHDTTIDLDFTSDSGSWDVNTVVKNRVR